MEELRKTFHRLQRRQKPLYHRQFYDAFTMNSRFVGLVGQRGIGKTTFLLYFINKHYGTSTKALYVSGDDAYFTQHSLRDIVDEFVTYEGGELLCIDEIHRYQNWNQELKNIYDFYPSIKVLFSGSSSIDLVRGKYDLSRRAILRHMYGLSFREYLEIETKQTYPRLTLKEILNRDTQLDTIGNIEKIMGHFNDYLQFGYYPTVFEREPYDVFHDKLLAAVEKTIYIDISAAYNIQTANLSVFKKLLYFYATSQPGSINIYKLAKSLRKDHSTIASYLQILRDTGLLRFLLNDKYGHAFIRNAEKVYLDNTNILCAFNYALGKKAHEGVAREIFALSALENAGYKVSYTEPGDMLCEDYIFEIGGKGKSTRSLTGTKNAYYFLDDIVYASGNTIPLYLLGFLY